MASLTSLLFTTWTIHWNWQRRTTFQWKRSMRTEWLTPDVKPQKTVTCNKRTTLGELWRFFCHRSFQNLTQELDVLWSFNLLRSQAWLEVMNNFRTINQHQYPFHIKENKQSTIRVLVCPVRLDVFSLVLRKNGNKFLL